MSNFEGCSIDISDCNYIHHSKADNYSQYKLSTFDVVVSTVGSWPNNPDSIVGKVVIVPAFANGSLLNQNAVRFRAKKQSMQLHVFHSLATEDFSSYVVSGVQGSANQASVTLYHLFDFKILIADTSIEKSFEGIIKIINNHKSNLEMESFRLAHLSEIILLSLA